MTNQEHDPNQETVSLDELMALSQATAKSERYTLRTAADALQPQPPIDWLVDGLISAGSVSLIVGEGGSKKTWLCLDLAVCVATGEPWLGRPTIPAPVLIIDEESGERRLADRLGKTLRGHQAGADTPVYYVSLAQFDISQPDDVNAIDSLIRDTQAQVVIIDALADVMPGRDENAVKDTQPVFMALRRVAESTQAAIIIIHHSNKSGDYRGSTAIKGAVDLMLMVESKAESPNVDIRAIKARDIPPPRLAAVCHWGDDDTFSLTESTITTQAAPMSKAKSYVLRYLAEHGEATVGQIMAAADTCSGPAAKNALYALVPEYVYRTNPGTSGGRGNEARFALTDQGKNYQT